MTRTVLLLVLCTVAVSCAPQTRFAWGGYENSLYRYSKSPEQRENYREALEKAVAKGQEDNRVAPGLLAELGYLALEDGDSTRSVAYFEQEMTLFPESRPFMESVIKKIKGGQSVGDDNDLVS